MSGDRVTMTTRPQHSPLQHRIVFISRRHLSHIAPLCSASTQFFVGVIYMHYYFETNAPEAKRAKLFTKSVCAAKYTFKCDEEDSGTPSTHSHTNARLCQHILPISHLMEIRARCHHTSTDTKLFYAPKLAREIN